MIVTPNTLTEAINLGGQIAEPARRRVMAAKSREIVVASREAAHRPEFPDLGLTDAALMQIASDQQIILTADLGLYLAAIRSGKPAINFNHYRENLR
jgi:hypothetical protein